MQRKKHWPSRLTYTKPYLLLLGQAQIQLNQALFYLDSEWDNKMDKLEIVITKVCSLGAEGL